MKNKKRLSILSLLSALVVLFPRPAHAAGLPGFVNNILDIVSSRLGLSLGEKLNGYLEIGLGKLDTLLGLDSSSLGSITGVLGGVDPTKAAQSIDDSTGNDRLKDSLEITPTAEGRLKKGVFNTGLANAIGSSVLSTDGQSALKDSSDAAGEVVKGSSKLADSAQGMSVTQDIAKVHAKQNAQEIQILNLQSEKQNLQIQQQAATTVATSVSANHANAEEQRIEDQIQSENQATTQVTGVGSGYIGGM